MHERVIIARAEADGASEKSKIAIKAGRAPYELLGGRLGDEQRAWLAEIAGKTPVTPTRKSGVAIVTETRLVR